MPGERVSMRWIRELPCLTGEWGDAPIVFQTGAWSQCLGEIVVFDDLFVAENVHAGLFVDAQQRQNLHELILGAQGVALNQTLQGHVARIEEHNRELRTRADAIPAAVRGSFSVDAFCVLKQCADIDTAIQEAGRNLAAARAADAVRKQTGFEALSLPEFDVTGLAALLERDLPELEAAAASGVQAHLGSLGAGGEVWVGDGMKRIEPATAAAGHKICPFCAQDLHGSALIAPYRAYFSAAYDELKQAILRELANLRSKYSSEIVAAFERSIRVGIELKQFWSQFTEDAQIEIVKEKAAAANVAALTGDLAQLRSIQLRYRRTSPHFALTISPKGPPGQRRKSNVIKRAPHLINTERPFSRLMRLRSTTTSSGSMLASG
jgi:hypothetical protein